MPMPIPRPIIEVYGSKNAMVYLLGTLFLHRSVEWWCWWVNKFAVVEVVAYLYLVRSDASRITLSQVDRRKMDEEKRFPLYLDSGSRDGSNVLIAGCKNRKDTSP